MRTHFGAAVACITVSLLIGRSDAAPVPAIVYDGPTLAEFSQILTDLGLRVTPHPIEGGGSYLDIDAASGVEFNAAAVGCHPACDGIVFFAQHKAARNPSFETLNARNAQVRYVKFTRESNGALVGALEHVSAGGITKDNVKYTMTAFVQGLVNYSKQNDEMASAGAVRAFQGKAVEFGAMGDNGFAKVSEEAVAVSFLQHFNVLE